MGFKRFTFITLILVVTISGMSQGLTIPLLTILLENKGVSSVANGLNATALYIGILVVSPWMEIPLRRLGYRTTILAGLCLVTGATLLFPVFQSYAIWFMLRLVLGIGDVALHYASQMWVTVISPQEHRGRNLSIYGLAYGVGFSIGPLGIYLLNLGIFVPFLAITAVYIVAFAMLASLKNDYPEAISSAAQSQNKYVTVIRLSWLALLPSFLYGFMEASLNNSLPIYVLKTGLDKNWVPLFLVAFTAGSLVLQLPIGILSDRVGRKKVMMVCAAIGALMFFFVPLAGTAVWLMAELFAVAGGVVGSFYSLGLAFASDILPGNMLPTAGIITGMNYSIASILAPSMNGVIFDYLNPSLMFGAIGLMLFFFTFSAVFFSTRQLAAEAKI